MANLKIRIYKTGQAKPHTVVTIPLRVVRIVAKFVPKKARSALEEQGIDLNEIATLAEKGDVTGTIVEVEKETERIVLAIE